MEKVTLSKDKNLITVEGVYTFYGGEYALVKITSNNNDMELVIDENGEMDFIFKTSLSLFKKFLENFLKEGEGKVSGISSFSGQTEVSEIALNFTEGNEDVILRVNILCKSIILSKKTVEEILEKIKNKINW